VTPFEGKPPPWRLVAVSLWILAALASAWLLAPILDGYFISDDFVPLVLFHRWQEQGILGAQLVSKFWAGLDAGANHFYRPVSYFTFGLNWWTSGTDPAGWMWVNVAAHVASGVMAGALGAMLAAERPLAREWACAALGAVFFVFAAPGAEVVAWISGRFDALATFFTLLSCLAFWRSRRPFDAMAWLSLAAAELSFLSKESSAILPLAIVLLASLRPAALAEASLARRAAAALRTSLPWLVLAVLYLFSRYVFFGSATQVYGGSQPLHELFSAAHWKLIVAKAIPWFRLQWIPAYRYPWLLALTAAQLAIFFFAVPDRRVRATLAALAAIVVLTLLVLLPHFDNLPEVGVGGRLLYQTTAFYAVFVVVGLRHARLQYLAWGTTLGLAILHVSFMGNVIARWKEDYSQMRALVAAIGRFDASLAPGDYAVVFVPGPLNGVPFGGNAQAGLMLPPIFPMPLSSRLVVQLNDELPDIPAKLADGLVATLRAHDVFAFLAGARAHGPIELPNRAACWNTFARQLDALEMRETKTPKDWGDEAGRALKASRCREISALR
jgi:hypothetical protein